MIEISPKIIKGEWDSGYALDNHTLHSDYIGDDEFGNPQFDTQRSELGELLYRLKYKSDRSVLKLIVETACDFISKQKWTIDVLIPVPPSRSTRSFQPVTTIAKEISNNLGIKLCTDCIVKTKETPQLKNIYTYEERMDMLKGVHAVTRKDLVNRKVLLLDDLYRSGATLNTITHILKTKGRVDKVYTIVLTKTRRKR